MSLAASLSRRAYRALIRLYPPEFRAEWAAELLTLFDDCIAAERKRGGAWLWRLWASTLRDLVTSVRREGEDIRTVPIPPVHPPGKTMGTLVQDLRYAWRALRRSPGFTAVVVSSLALGIGANALIFSLVDGIVLRPYDLPEPGRLMAVGVSFPSVDPERRYIEAIGAPEFADIRARQTGLASVFAYDLGNRNLSGGDRPERVATAFLWGDPFATIGLKPHLGRGFSWEETTGGGPLAILSYRLWKNRFAADSAIIGRAVQVNGVPYTVTGVMPQELLVLGTDLWVPMGIDPHRIPRQARQYAIIGRMAEGATIASVNIALGRVATETERQYAAERPEYAGWSLAVTPWAEVTTGDYRTLGMVLLGAVGLVLLMACANIASLMLARSASRAREIAVRRALGAGSSRIARQLLTESLLLALVGCLLGIGVARLLLKPSIGLLPDSVVNAGIEPSINGAVLLYALALGALAAMVFGLTPAWRAVRGTQSDVLTPDTGRATTSRQGRSLRHGFTVMEVALALVLLAGAGVLVRGFARLQAIDPGFDRERILTMRLSLPRERYDRAKVASFFEDLATRLEGVPGVERAAAGTQFPPDNGFTAPVEVEGESRAANDVREVDVTNVTERYFATLGYTLVRGRAFTSTDHETAPRVAVLNERAAKRLFGSADPVGHRIRLGEGDERQWIEIVGVAKDVRNRGLDVDPAPEVFVPVRQMEAEWNNQLFLLVKTAGRPELMLPMIRNTIVTMDADQPAYLIRTVDEAFAASSEQRRTAAVLLGALSAVALLLAAIGIYGLLSYLVSERTQEFGIRLALGAEGRDVVSMVLRQTAIVLGIGTLLGIAGALALGRGLARLAYGIQPGDPLTLAAVSVVLLVVGLLATLLPARRATRVDPVVALRA
ncbi:MAG TPA: ABC transporter permease [Gemmatimonadales bacterium]|nr:ABC transporter permease [Gemmatimonadales bacterium]